MEKQLARIIADMSELVDDIEKCRESACAKQIDQDIRNKLGRIDAVANIVSHQIKDMAAIVQAYPPDYVEIDHALGTCRYSHIIPENGFYKLLNRLAESATNRNWIDRDPIIIIRKDSDGFVATAFYDIGDKNAETECDDTELTYSDLVRGNVRVQWVNGGEGYCDDYDPDDPDDKELLRFYIGVRDGDEWRDIDDASYCTLVPANADRSVLDAGLRMLMDEVYDEVVDGHSIKKLCERLSWISEESIKASHYYTEETHEKESQA